MFTTSLNSLRKTLDEKFTNSTKERPFSHDWIIGKGGIPHEDYFRYDRKLSRRDD